MLLFITGENLYIGYLIDNTPGVSIQRKQLSIPGVITPSRDSFTFCDYNNSSEHKSVKTVRMPFHALTSKVPDLVYWEPAQKFISNRSLPHNIVTMDRELIPHKLCVLFIAQVPPTIVHDGKVIGHYDKAKFPADFDGPIVGAGQAWFHYSWQNDKFQFKSFNVNVFYDGKLIEAPIECVSVLCAYKMPTLSHYTLPEVKWEIISDGSLPTDALPAGIFPDGEILYVGENQHRGDQIPGYVVHREKCLHLCWGSGEHCYDKGYKLLIVDELDAFEWNTYSNGEVPSTAIPGGATRNGETLYIGRTVTNSDVMVGKTWQRHPISLPHSRVTDTQLIGKIHCSHKCLYVPWAGKEYIYPSYEVLMGKMRPKSLQHLCRNVIITATLGIPGRVDKLPIPLNLKDFCKM